MAEAQEQGAATAADEARSLEALSNKKAALQQRADDLAKKIRDLGSLPEDAFSNYRNKGVKVCVVHDASACVFAQSPQAGCMLCTQTAHR